MNDERDISPARLTAMREALAAHVASEPVRAHRTRRRRIVIGSLLSLLVVGGATTAGLQVLAPAEVVDTSIVLCTHEAKRDANGELFGQYATMSGPFNAARRADAIELCSLMWERGELQRDRDPLALPPDEPLPVPPLTVCVDPNGRATVVPSDAPEICTALHLAVPAKSSGAD